VLGGEAKAKLAGELTVFHSEYAGVLVPLELTSKHAHTLGQMHPLGSACSSVQVKWLQFLLLTVRWTRWNRMDAKTHPETEAALTHASRAELEERVTELREERSAISEVLHAIASSPHELQPIFDAILVNATRLCRADSGSFRLCEYKGLRLVALKGAPEHFQRWSPPTLLEYTSGYGLLATNGSPIHIADLATH
jgi:hypothetical protein